MVGWAVSLLLFQFSCQISFCLSAFEILRSGQVLVLVGADVLAQKRFKKKNQFLRVVTKKNKTENLPYA